MCSGTFLAEAAMIACNIPANINRKEFAFEKNDWDNELFDNITDTEKKFSLQYKGLTKAHQQSKEGTISRMPILTNTSASRRL
jgi:putative N6-adenine-specific DNA methylase